MYVLLVQRLAPLCLHEPPGVQWLQPKPCQLSCHPRPPRDPGQTTAWQVARPAPLVCATLCLLTLHHAELRRPQLSPALLASSSRASRVSRCSPGPLCKVCAQGETQPSLLFKLVRRGNYGPQAPLPGEGTALSTRCEFRTRSWPPCVVVGMQPSSIALKIHIQTGCRDGAVQGVMV